jgi:hypothetical protein
MSIHSKTTLFTELIAAESAVVSGGASPTLILQSKTKVTLYNADGHGKIVTFAISDIDNHPRNNPDQPQLFLPAASGRNISL